MAYAFVQAAHNADWSSTTATTLTCSYGSNVTAGNLLVAVLTWADAGASEDVSSITDSRSTSWATCPSALIRDTSNAQMFAIWYGIAGGSGANTITVTYPGSRNFKGVSVGEFSVSGQVPTLESSGGQVNASGTSQPSGSISVTNNGALIVSGTVRTTGGADAFTVSQTTLSNTGVADNQASQYEIQTTAATTAGNFTYGGAGIGIVGYAVFYLASAASAALTGTATASITEADIVTGGKTLIITLTGDTWIAS